MKNLNVNPDRYGEEGYNTGIFIRALTPEGKWDSVDIAVLDKESLFEFLRSRGGENVWAENCVSILFGYGNF